MFIYITVRLCCDVNYDVQSCMYIFPQQYLCVYDPRTVFQKRRSVDWPTYAFGMDMETGYVAKLRAAIEVSCKIEPLWSKPALCCTWKGNDKISFVEHIYTYLTVRSFQLESDCSEQLVKCRAVYM
jgi:hypothetical protein